VIAESLKIPVATICSHLVDKIGFQFLLRWVSHTLTSELRQKRVELSSQLLRVLESQQRVGFRTIMTDDGSWFLWHYDRRQIWCLSADEVPTRMTHTTAAPRTMLTVF
jgi:hypothetical protein